MAVRLFVGNLPYDVTEAELREHFAAVGPLSYISLPMDRDTGKPRGFAFVEFSERADAEEAIRRLNNQAFKGRQLAVNEARARDDRSTPNAPRASTPRPPFSAAPSTGRPPPSRPPFSAEPSTGDSRSFGPDAAPRRRRRPAKGATKFERGPKRPIRKRAAGPVRFGTEDDDDFDDDESDTPFASHVEDTDDQDTE
jgi:RNA recognition motif-containing protein